MIGLSPTRIKAPGSGFTNTGSGRIFFGTSSGQITRASFTQTALAMTQMVVDANLKVIPVSVSGKASFGGTLSMVFAADFQKTLTQTQPFQLFKYGSFAGEFNDIKTNLTPGIITRGKEKFMQRFIIDPRYLQNRFFVDVIVRLVKVK